MDRRRVAPQTSFICAQTLTAAKRTTTLILTDQESGEVSGEAITGGACGASGIGGPEPEATRWVHLPLPTPTVRHLEVEEVKRQDAEKAAHNREVQRASAIENQCVFEFKKAIMEAAIVVVAQFEAKGRT